MSCFGSLTQRFCFSVLFHFFTTLCLKISYTDITTSTVSLEAFYDYLTKAYTLVTPTISSGNW